MSRVANTRSTLALSDAVAAIAAAARTQGVINQPRLSAWPRRQRRGGQSDEQCGQAALDKIKDELN